MNKLFVGISMLFALLVITGCKPDIIEDVKCEVNGKDIKYRFEKHHKFDQKSYSNDGDVYIYNEDRFLLRVISNAECDIQYTQIVDDK